MVGAALLAAGTGYVLWMVWWPLPQITFSSVAVRQSYRTVASHGETDSLAIYRDDAAGIHWLFATDKTGNRLQVLDAATGTHIRDLGTSGSGPEQFNRPNGVAVWTRPIEAGHTAAATSQPASATSPMQRGGAPGDAPGSLLFVAERDGRRVQVFALPSLQYVTTFGTGELERSYGVGAMTDSSGMPVVFVTDNSRNENQRVRRYELDRRVTQQVTDAGRRGMTFRCTSAFGDTSGKGELLLVESIAIDPTYGRLLVCDEHRRRRNIKVYNLDGSFSGTTLGDGYFTDDPEGVVVWPAGDNGRGGWIIATNQGKELTTWHVFDRASLRHVGAFIAAPPVANTDGIAMTPGTLGALGGGALFAVDDDGPIVAIAWDLIAQACGLAQP